MAKTATNYWRMILQRAWNDASAQARSWAFLAAIVIGGATYYGYLKDDLRLRLVWQIPLGLVIMLLVVHLPLAIYRAHREAE